jgi:hypothetical protein
MAPSHQPCCPPTYCLLDQQTCTTNTTNTNTNTNTNGHQHAFPAPCSRPGNKTQATYGFNVDPMSSAAALVTLPSGVPIWSPNADEATPGPTSMCMQPDASFALVSAEGTPMWASDPAEDPSEYPAPYTAGA